MTELFCTLISKYHSRIAIFYLVLVVHFSSPSSCIPLLECTNIDIIVHKIHLFVGKDFSLSNFIELTMFLLQSVETFFSQVMAVIGGNTAGPGMLMFDHNPCA